MSGILFSTVVNAGFVAKLLISGILFSISVILAGTGTNLSISNLSTSVFKLAKIIFNAKLDLSTCEIFLISVFVA